MGAAKRQMSSVSNIADGLSEGRPPGIGGRLLSRMARLRREREGDLAAYRLLVASLYSSPASLTQGGIAAALTCLLCWLASASDLFLHLTVVTGIVAAIRSARVVVYARRDRTNDAVERVRAWELEFLVGSTALSLCLGLNCFLALVSTEVPSVHLIAVATTIAFSSGYVARNAGRPVFVTIQLVLFCAPMALGFLVKHDPFYNAIGYFCFLFVAGNIAITLSVHRNLVALSDANRQSEILTSALSIQNVTLDAALNNMNFGLAMFDRDLDLAVSNRRFGDLSHLSIVAGSSLAEIERDVASRSVFSADQTTRLALTCRQVNETRREASFDLVTRDGRNLVVSVEPVPDQGVLVLLEDATDRKTAEATIERMARFDELTGLANRFELSSVLAKVSDQPGEFRFALLYIDLDNFKQVNDSLGHEAGDTVLIEAAARLRDAIGPGDLVARFGGDEFVVVQFGGDRSDALASRIVDKMSPAFDIQGRLISVTASIGVALAPEHGDSASDVLRHADLALYKAKAAGRSTYATFSHELGRAAAERQDLEASLKRALLEDSLRLFYQPIIDLGTGEIVSFEALMRWQHAAIGMVSPTIFIPLAEETGLISAMGEWAIERACLDAAAWSSRVSVAVNVSPIQFRDPEKLINAVVSALCRSRLAPERLYLEVTESLMLDNQEGTLSAIQRLRQLGVRFSLDDFGIGYSSLAYLSTYPFSQVKVDRSFAETVTSNTSSEVIIEAVCSLSRRLGMSVVVEGIETSEQMEAVKRLGAERAQGFLFGRPKPIEHPISATARRVA